MSHTPSDAEKRKGKRPARSSSPDGVSKSESARKTVKKPPTYHGHAYLFDGDELPTSKSSREKIRKRERQEKLEEQETVLHLIDSMRYGVEPKTRSYGRARSVVGREPSTTKTARIASGGLRVHWARFKQRLGPGTAPSESLFDVTGESSNSSRSVRLRTIGHVQAGEDTDDAAEVDEIVVDNVLGTVTGGSQASEHLGTGHAASGSGRPDFPGAKSHPNSYGTMEVRNPGIWDSNIIFSFFRWTAWPLILHFFKMRFTEDKTENDFRRETAWYSKTLGIYSSVFFLVDWILILALSARPFSLSDRIFYYGFGSLITLPLPFLVIFDYPERKQIFYQVYLAISVWSWSCYTTIYMYACNFFEPHGPNRCGSRDFIGVIFFAVGLPAIAIFGLRQTRIANTIGFSVFFILTCALILPQHPAYTRNVIDALLFHAFLLYIHYKRETTERRNFSLRDQLKAQFRATQNAQINERRANDSKRRLTSYVFHEVRVPLNTALLAVQNMEAMGEIHKSKEIEWSALAGSLSMMSKVLNDVLDFDRLDSGRFSTVKIPYNLHQTVRSILVPLGLAARARGLTLIDDLDKNIDRIARRAALAAKGLDAVAISAELAKLDEDGIVIGDEMRLRQIINNLASNACKFTPAGGEIRVITRLVLPLLPSAASDEGTETAAGNIAPAAFPAPDVLSKVTDAEGDKEKSAELPTTARPEEQNNSASKWTERVKETEHSSLNSLKRSLFPWRWQSFRKRSNTVVNDSEVHVRDMLDVVEKGGMRATAALTPLSAAQLMRHNSVDLNNMDRIVVRIEVHDTGIGIRPRDLVDNKLFSPYVQTEIGKYQGGKGTGLGLALVRRIVKLSGGRLGVRSKLGEGSTFWVELPLGVGNAKSDSKDRPDILHDGSDYSEGQRQLALGLEDLKFARAIGEGETPSTMLTDQDAALMKNKETKQNSVLSLRSEGALKNVMDQRGLFEIAPPPLPRPGRGTPPLTVPKPDLPSPTLLPVIPPTPPQTSSQGEKSQIAEGDDREEKEMGTIPDAGPAGEALRVLVVDDDAITRSLMSRMLTRLGCAVTTAENGKIALEKILGGAAPPSVIRGERGTGMGMSNGVPPQEVEKIPEEQQVYLFDIVFLDNQMPVMSGVDTVTALRTLGRRDFVVGVTGNALLSDQQEYLDVGVDRILTKPVLEGSLKSMLTIAVRKKQERTSTIQEAPTTK